MESLAEETWDLVIAGTGLVQALLALSLSQSGLKILHVDENTYYGGSDAGLSLDEAQSWAELHKSSSTTFSRAQISQTAASSSKLAASRSYTLSLKPQIVYAQSKFLPSLVSSNINTQLEFLAVGSWWIYKQGSLQKVPSTREDVFADDSLSRRDKIGLMKFLRHVVQDNEDDQNLEADSLRSALSTHFKLSPGLQLPISSLALTPYSVSQTPVELAVPRVRRHMTSMGYFGQGFGSVIAKYAGNAEVAQVCCRACAVGGATYLLDQALTSVTAIDSQDLVEISLASGVIVKSRYVASGPDDFPAEYRSKIQTATSQASETCHLISIISAPLRHLFPATSENGPVPAAAIIMVVDTDDDTEALSQPPIYLQIHSEDTGECPSGQCIIYASILSQLDSDPTSAFERLSLAVAKVIRSSGDDSTASDPSSPTPEVLWSMSYVSKGAPITNTPSERYSTDPSGRILAFPSRSYDIAFDDSVLDSVKAVWKKILGDAADENAFLRFEAKSTETGDEG